MKKIIIASHNLHKIREVKNILKDLEYQFIGLNEIPDMPEIKETGQTFLENALIKARTIHNISGLPTIADDTGLEVDYLNGAPGIFSARFAGNNATDQENLDKVLTKLISVPDNMRIARFKTVVAFVDKTKELWTEGIVRGTILAEPRGKNGFGYDSIFLASNTNKTLAELTMKEKNIISHRGLALEKFRNLLAKDNLTK